MLQHGQCQQGFQAGLAGRSPDGRAFFSYGFANLGYAACPRAADDAVAGMDLCRSVFLGEVGHAVAMTGIEDQRLTVMALSSPRSYCSIQVRSDLVAMSNFTTGFRHRQTLLGNELNGFSFKFCRENTAGYAFHGLSLQVDKLTSTCPSRKSGLAHSTNQCFSWICTYA